MHRLVQSVLAVLVLALVAPAAASAADTQRYILPPGNYGGLPTTDELARPAAALRRADAAARQHHPGGHQQLLPARELRPIGATHEENTGRPGLKLIYDSYGIPHVYGKTRADVAFGAGWTTARDRGLLLQLGRGPARVAVADVPGINAFWLVTSAQSFVPSPEAENLVTEQKNLLVKTYGAKGRQIIADAQAYADGVNAYWKSDRLDQPPATVNDVIAVTAFIGSIFGAGGGGEATNSDLLAKLQKGLGQVRGYRAWDDVMLADDPEAPTTIKRRFDYPVVHRRRPDRLGRDRPRLDPVDDRRQPLAATASTAPSSPTRRSSTPQPRPRASRRRTSRSSRATARRPATRSPPWARSSATTTPRSSSRSTCTARASRPRASACPAWRCTS